MKSRRRRAVVRGAVAIYHAMSRTTCRQYLFGDSEKEMFVRMMRRQAEFCGVDILAYCILSNHFHILARVRYEPDITDRELLRRYHVLYRGERLPPNTVKPEELERMLERGGEDAQEARERILARMGNLSVFMRELKQRFAIWYNRTHNNRGTIWSERFKSLVVEPSREAMVKVAAYIDLNPVRAELVEDPADYRFCSYAAAIAQVKQAQEGYLEIYFGREWKEVIRSYRIYLFGRGGKQKSEVSKAHGRIPIEKVHEVIKNGGKLEMAELLRRRVRYFSDGMVIGSKNYLKEFCEQNRELFPENRRATCAKMKGAEWGDLAVVRNLQKDVFG